ncbi:MAG TPA: FAD-dependent oxidoreductase [Chitinispirillaceae bacterium]|jgi:NADPH-dependent 2,4-dienoyl-CoA reductase/sulfur reductase-like enzyme|nr:FAD-dependent oxidoreductase [Chitinispirillaceae bacterium]
MYNYIIVGAGIAAAHAAKGIREIDKEGSILMIGNEPYLPYNRTYLSKDLWTGKKKLENIIVHDQAYYDSLKVEIRLNTTVTNLDPAKKTITTDDGTRYSYNKLLLAAGAQPRKLSIPGADLKKVCYFRTIDDYKTTRSILGEGKSVVLIGGGFIGSEIAASLALNKVKVQMIFPEKRICNRVMPSDLADFLTNMYSERGIRIDSEDVPVSISEEGEKVRVITRNGLEFQTDFVIAGLGVRPETELASKAGLRVKNGIEVNEYLQTSDADIFAAGDNASFPYLALHKQMRVEHWDNAINQGLYVGRNMAGAESPYSHLPFFFSDLFEFGYEAVGDLNSELEVKADWKKPFEKGVLYYLEQHRVRGIMLCDVWGKVPDARRLIKEGTEIPGKERILFD